MASQLFDIQELINIYVKLQKRVCIAQSIIQFRGLFGEME